MSEEMRPATPEEAREVLQDFLEGRATRLGVKFKTRAVLEKFDGDPPAYPGEKQPVERIVLDDDGNIIEHEIRGVPQALRQRGDG